jgi:hypothetical protein
VENHGEAVFLGNLAALSTLASTLARNQDAVKRNLGAWIFGGFP